MPRTRREPARQGTRRDQRSQKSISRPPLDPIPDRLAARLEYVEGRRNLQRIEEVRDGILDWTQTELGKLWRQVRGGYEETEDFRHPQSLDQFGRVARVYDKGRSSWHEGDKIANTSLTNTFTKGIVVNDEGAENQFTTRRTGASQWRMYNDNQNTFYRYRLDNAANPRLVCDEYDGSEFVTFWKANAAGHDFISVVSESQPSASELTRSSTSSCGSAVMWISTAGTTEYDLNFRYKDSGNTTHDTKIHRPCFACLTKNGAQVTTAAFANLNGWTSKVNQGTFVPNIGTGAVQVPQTGYYKIDGYVNGSSTSAARSTLYVNVDEDQGSGTFVTIAQQMCYAKRDATNFEGGVAFSVIHQLDEGDEVRLQVKTVGATLSIGTLDAILNLQRIY